ncbi:MAG: hypothetical protein ACR2IE_13165 [Candidatus Sumerlaeaceae bacterium]
MRNYRSDAQFTTVIHAMVKHKVQGTLWDLLSWLDNGAELQSIRDMLAYIRLFSDFGDANQGRLFLNLIKDNPNLRLVLPDIASRFVSRGKTTSSTWLEELGVLIQTLHRAGGGHPGVEAVRRNDEASDGDM